MCRTDEGVVPQNRLNKDLLSLTMMPINGVIGIIWRGPVALAVWFQSANGWLGSVSPADVVRRVSPGEMSDVLHAARREVAPIDHA